MTDAELQAAVDAHKVIRADWQRGAWDGEPTEQHGPLDLDDEIAALEKVLDQ